MNKKPDCAMPDAMLILAAGVGTVLGAGLVVVRSIIYPLWKRRSLQ